MGSDGVLWGPRGTQRAVRPQQRLHHVLRAAAGHIWGQMGSLWAVWDPHVPHYLILSIHVNQVRACWGGLWALYGTYGVPMGSMGSL